MVVVRDFGPLRHDRCGPRCHVARVALKQSPPIILPYDEEGIPSAQLHFSGDVRFPVRSSSRLVYLYEPRGRHERVATSPAPTGNHCSCLVGPGA